MLCLRRGEPCGSENYLTAKVSNVFVTREPGNMRSGNGGGKVLHVLSLTRKQEILLQSAISICFFKRLFSMSIWKGAMACTGLPCHFSTAGS